MRSEVKNSVFTIPNLLSLVRLLLIPVIVWLYVFRQDYFMTAAIVVLSGVTDIADGIIARKYHMISDFGKIFDPVADKLTQGALLICLVSRFPSMLLPLIVLAVKELIDAVTGLLVIRKTGLVLGAAWHGKLATVCLYGTMIVHIIFFDISTSVSGVLIGISTSALLLSAVLYGTKNIRLLIASAAEKGKDGDLL